MFDIELLMKDLKLNQNELASILNVSQTAISRVKNGKMDIPETWVDFLNEKYDITITKYFNSNVVSEPAEEYSSAKDENEDLMKSLFNLTESNKILAYSVQKAIDLNQTLINKMYQEDMV